MCLSAPSIPSFAFQLAERSATQTADEAVATQKMLVLSVCAELRRDIALEKVCMANIEVGKRLSMRGSLTDELASMLAAPKGAVTFFTSKHDRLELQLVHPNHPLLSFPASTLFSLGLEWSPKPQPLLSCGPASQLFLGILQMARPNAVPWGSSILQTCPCYKCRVALLLPLSFCRASVCVPGAWLETRH